MAHRLNMIYNQKQYFVVNYSVMKKYVFLCVMLVSTLLSVDVVGQCDPSVPYPFTDPVMIQLIATNPDCCFGTWTQACQDLYDSLAGGGGGGCDATFTNETFDGYLYTFAASTGALIYQWDYGDGSLPLDLESTVTHTFASDGVYNVCLTTICADFTQGSYCEEITVGLLECESIDNGSAPYEISDPLFQQVVADNPNCCDGSWDTACEDAYQEAFNALPCIGSIIVEDQGNGIYQFSSQEQNQGVSLISEWDFGDGETSANTESTVSHQYTEVGTFEVCVTVICADGDEEQTCTDIEIDDAPCSAIVDPAFPYEESDPYVTAAIAANPQCCSNWSALCDQAYGEFANEDVSGSFQGTVVQQDSNPVPTALVDVYDSFGELLFTVISDENGNILIEGIPAGSYVVNVSGQGIAQTSLYNFEIDYLTPNLEGQSIPVVTDGTATASLESIGIQLFPNPATDQITIRNLQDCNSIQILSTSGKVVMEESTQMENIVHLDLHALSSGLYFVQINTIEASYQSKLIKQ